MDRNYKLEQQNIRYYQTLTGADTIDLPRPPSIIFIYVYYLVFMMTDHKRNTLNNYRMNQNYTGIYNIIDNR